jgi:hypothetical protein
MLKYHHNHHHHQAAKKKEMIKKKIKILTKNPKDNLLKMLMRPGSWNYLKSLINASK